MKNLMKKNRLMITALALMLAIAGYLQFSGKAPDKTITTSADNVVNEKQSVFTENYIAENAADITSENLSLEELGDADILDSDLEMVYVEDYLDTDMQMAEGVDLIDSAVGMPEEGEIPGEAVFTSADALTVLSQAKLLKEQTRAKNKETLLSIINSEGLTDIQKQTAVDNMVAMTTVAEKESAAEILLEAKGFRDVVVSINGNMADVVVNAAALDDAKRAQIEDIVNRKTDITPENIVISTIVP